MLKAIEGSHSTKVSKLEVEIRELERNLGKKTSSLMKEKTARKAKSSEVRRLQRQIESGEGSTSRGSRMDLALAIVEGGMVVVQALQGETPLALQAEETRLSDCKGDLAAVDGDFDLVFADLKSMCFLPTCSEGLVGKDLTVEEDGGDAAPCLDEARGEGEDWPLVALNPCRFVVFFL
ncbi:hypothetical protein F2Q68_00034320 [Brassica cretica]|uniref:Uncharacterized protein n=1 Tax=Brassica cretica TaxID=69181 RepID=A0A8S9GYI3_BRACR|nr:hypothetical protein F2Q68_00034320 [Brassica cretica]